MKDKKEKNPFSLRERFQYWFDNRMTKGSLGLIRVLIIASVLLAILIAALIIGFGFNEEGEHLSVFWDSIATVINAWMPYFSDGSPGYLILMSVTAIAGVLFTSVLIGIITSAIEEKIDNLKRGNSLVLEKGHTVVLGFTPGEYTLLRQLILAADGKPDCLVIAEDLEREEMEEALAENLEVPKNFRIVCRTVDITDPASIEKCSVETSKTVIISPTNDMRTIKAVLAVSALLQEKDADVRVNAIISRNYYHFPPSLAEAHNISTLQTSNILAKMIAHSCTQTGLSEAFREMFNFEGSEFYLIDVPGIDGWRFEDLAVRLDQATPAGILRGEEILLNPSADDVLKADDRILVFSEATDSAKLTDAPETVVMEDIGKELRNEEEETGTVILGHNETLPLILHELPENVTHVYLAGQMSEEEWGVLERIAERRNLELQHCKENPRQEQGLLALAQMADHIVVLSDHDKDVEEADMEIMFELLNLRDIRSRYDLHFNITVEMQEEHNQNLVGRGDHTDFLVASSMSSLLLAQLAESPELIGVFREILSNEGNELYLKNAGVIGMTGTYQVRDLRRILLRHGYIFMGHLDAEKYSRFNLPLEEELRIAAEDYLIVLGRN